MSQRDEGPAWGRQFGADATLDEVTAAADRWVAHAVATLAEDLAADPDFTSQQRAALMAKAAPLIHAQTHTSFLQAWAALRAEAAEQTDADGTTVH